MEATPKTVSTSFGEITLVTLTNDLDNYVVLSSLGAGINAIVVPDRDGKKADVVIGYENPADYMDDGPCAGKTPGRCANRIAYGRFTLNGKEYQLPVNNGPNHLHGGPGANGYNNRIWNTEIIEPNCVKFTLHSPDGDAGYPGNLEVAVTYTWDNDNNLTIEYDATSDAPTIVNLTNHSYFNLGGHNTGSLRAHKQLLKLNCSRWLRTNDNLIPTGEKVPVEGTVMDFRTPCEIGSRIFPAGEVPKTENLNTSFEAIKFGKGYDHCWLSDFYVAPEDHKDALQVIPEVAVLSDPESGRVLTISTDQPGIQVYGGDWVGGCPAGKDGAVYDDYCAIALECQGCPDAINHPEFPSSEVTPDKPYHRTIIFSFSAE